MNLSELITKINTNPSSVIFNEVIETIDLNYDFTPSSFKNGDFFNEEGKNNGSCKVFAFATLNQLSKEETLHCFGDYYRKDVLENLEGTDHQNIRNFIKYGWSGISYEKEALKLK